MSNIGELVERLVEQGIPVSEASEIIALAVAAGAATSSYRKSSAALRQQRYRDKNKTVTNRNESVTPLRVDERNESVTNRNESVTSNAASLSKEDIDINKKVKRESRATQLPDGWRPDDNGWVNAAERLGSEARAEAELLKFRNHALDKGRVSKRWGAAWENWIDRAVVYAGQQPRASPVARLTGFQQRRSETQDILNDLDNFARGRGGSSEADTRLLRHDPGERSEGVRGGSGADVIDLSTGGSRARGQSG